MPSDQDEIFNRAIPGLPCKDLVVRLCEEKGRHFSFLTYSACSKTFFIKYNSVTMEDAHAQVFFRLQLREKTNHTIRIPEISTLFKPGAEAGDLPIS